MKQGVFHSADGYIKEHKRKKRWYKVVTSLACVVVFCTVYALILPAITLEKAYCGFTEHTHSQDCYVQVPSVTKTELICTPESLGIHEHTADCYNANNELVCGYADFVVHVHNSSCFDEDGSLLCQLPEIETHTHTAGCFSASSDTNEPELICGKDSIILHTHSSDCFDSNGNLICGKIEVLEHIHTDECFQTLEGTDELVLICGLEEHQHTQECFNEDEDTEDDSQDNTSDEETPDSTIEYLGMKDYVAANGGTFTFSLADINNELLPTDDEGNYIAARGDTYELLLDISLPNGIASGNYQYQLPDGFDVHEESGEFYLQDEDMSIGTWTVDGSGLITFLFNENADNYTEVALSAVMEYSILDDVSEIRLTEEQLIIVPDAIEEISEEEQQAVYEQFLEEVVAFEAMEDSEAKGETADSLMSRLRESYQQGLLKDTDYAELYDRVYSMVYGDVNSIAEAATGTNWILLRDSGWFEAYSGYAAMKRSASFNVTAAEAPSAVAYLDDDDTYTLQPSDVQVTERGGTEVSDEGDVSVSKTISGTDIENVFDITLQVQTSLNIKEISEEPDMAVVIVMDISNTMNSNFGTTTRYAAAMDAAEHFLDLFTENNTLGISKVGYVAFNTDAHQIFGLQSCSTVEQANYLKNIMRTGTGNIINAAGYKDSHSRFTNIEAGLAMASDMLNGVNNKNKYIIFLSDGFPTTYISSGYSGYDPFDSTGRFYDYVLNKPCSWGNSYSDEAAIRARNKAAAIKASGTTIFSIGVGVDGQRIQDYITQSENANGFSVVDRTSTTYEIGNASSTDAYKNWLRNSIGSGYYYDSTDFEGLNSAYEQIFETIKHQVEEGARADWVAEDPLPITSDFAKLVEFIGFYNKTPELAGTELSGENTANGENTAVFSEASNTINWDLKESGYQATTSGGTTVYTYQLTYRVRLKNEDSTFLDGTVYPTNDTTTLQYRNVAIVDGNQTVSAPKTVEFPIPSVNGYLQELTFTKIDSHGRAVVGAEFTLHHDTINCGYCRGDGASSVAIEDKTAASGSDGTVSFKNIPSGHKYTLTETKIPDGYSSNGNTYSVEVAYDKITVTVKNAGGGTEEWNGTIENITYYELPETGGIGTNLYTIGGLALLIGSVILLLYNHKKHIKENFESS